MIEVILVTLPLQIWKAHFSIQTILGSDKFQLSMRSQRMLDSILSFVCELQIFGGVKNCEEYARKIFKKLYFTLLFALNVLKIA